MDEKQDLIRQLDEARAELMAALDGIDLNAQIYPGWTLKELFAHLAGWDDAVASSLRAHAGGREPATPAAEGINVYNAQSVETREPLSYTQTLKECEAARELLKAAIRDLPQEKFNERIILPWGGTSTVERLVLTFVHHDREEHAAEIRVFKAKSTN
jgi:uncharacterized protein (TIGR03083 family)